MKEQYFFRVQMTTDGETAEVRIYSSIASGKFWEDEMTPDDLEKQLKKAKKDGATKLNIRINSPGGEVFAAVAMRSIIINAEFESVRVMIEGLCASAATLFATIPGAHVVIADGSEFMIHNPMTIAIGNASALEKTVVHLRSMEGTFHEMYAAKCGKDPEQIKAWMDDETWFSARRAVEEGFCDELLETEKAVACVDSGMLAVMRATYRHVPDDLQVAAAEDDNGSNANPVAGSVSSNITNKEEPNTMEIKDITRDQLLAENPALAEEIRNAAVTAERERLAEIDALTMPGYEAMAEDAKRSGMSAMDFQKAIVKAQKEKGTAFMEARKQELSASSQVSGGSATDIGGKDEEAEIKAFQKEMAGYYARQSNNETMF